MEQTTKQEFKTFSLAIDMVRTIGQPPFEVVAGDTGNLLCISLTNDGIPVDLTGAYTCVIFRSSIGTALQDDTNGLMLSDATGEFTLQLLPESYGAGDVSADIQVYTGKSRETLITSRRFTFRCRNALLNDKTMQANGTYPPLISATHAATEAAAIALAAAERNGDMRIDIYDEDHDGVVERADHANHASTSDMLSMKSLSYFATAESVAAISLESLGGAEALHAEQHKPGGDDPITPADIGAAYLSSMLNATLSADAWTGTAAPYRYALQLPAIHENSVVELLPAALMSEEALSMLQAANIQDGGQGNGILTLLAYGEKPTADLPIRMIVRGDLGDSTASSAGGGSVSDGMPTIIITDSNHEKTLAGEALDMENITYSCSNMSLAEAVSCFQNGRPIRAVLLSAAGDSTDTSQCCLHSMMTGYSLGIIIMLFLSPFDNSMLSLGWDESGIQKFS